MLVIAERGEDADRAQMDIFDMHTCRMVICLRMSEGIKGEIQNRFNLILEDRVKIFEQNSENLMKIG